MGERVSVRVNGRARECQPGATILAALEQAGVQLPTLCHDPRLEPVAVCRLCLVEVHGESRPVPACTTRLRDGMVIETHTAELEAERRATLRMMAWRHPADGAAAPNPFCDQLAAHGLLGELGGGGLRAPGPVPVDDSHPYIRVDMARCIDCYRCQRICDDLQGQFVWRVENRGAEASWFRTRDPPWR
jgi:formate dehydrogenase major subunit